MPPPGIKPASPCFPACRSNHSTIGRANDMLKLLHYIISLQSINTCDNASTKCIWRLEPNRRSTFFRPPTYLYRNIVGCDVKQPIEPTNQAYIRHLGAILTFSSHGFSKFYLHILCIMLQSQVVY